MSNVIYQPTGAAKEYNEWAANFHTGCSGCCEYCYMKRISHGKFGKVATLKTGFLNDEMAIQTFRKEFDRYRDELIRHGLFFTFSSDPFLDETMRLNAEAINHCLLHEVPAYTLTKQVNWVERGLSPDFNNPTDTLLYSIFRRSINVEKAQVMFGFTLTGRDDMEKGAPGNRERIRAIKRLHKEGHTCWVSLEPVLDYYSAMGMLEDCCEYVGLIKVGMPSGMGPGKILSVADARSFYHEAIETVWHNNPDCKIFFKDSFILACLYKREELDPTHLIPVESNYKLHLKRVLPKI